MNKTDTADPHAGQGGSYVMENGKRVLQERAGQPAPLAVKPQPVKPQPVKPKKEGNK